MTYVYVLVSKKGKDLYYEQAIMSLYSLRLYMKNANVVVLMDTDTKNSLTFENGRASLLEYASGIVGIDFQENVSGVERSRLIKTSIPEYIKDDFLYIDCDTVIAGDLSSVQDCGFDLAGVLDCHTTIKEHIHARTFLQRDKKLGFIGTKTLGYNINGGVLFAKKGGQTNNFFEQWNKAWKYSAYKKKDFHDQSALNQANVLTGSKIGLLAGEWNCQPCHRGLCFLQNAKIIHYYSSEMNAATYIPYYKIADVALQKKVQQTSGIPQDIKNMLQSPKFLFCGVHLVSDTRLVSVMQSPLVWTLADIKKTAPLIFAIMEGTMAILRSFVKAIAKKIKRKKS